MSPSGPGFNSIFLSSFFACFLAILVTCFLSFLLSDVTATPPIAVPANAATRATTATSRAGEA